jgi:hypothetical protein
VSRTKLDVAPQPWHEFVEAEHSLFIQPGDEGIGVLGIRRQLRAVDGQKRIGGGKSRSLVAVDERMVLGQALPKRGRFLDEIGVVAGLRPI